MPEHTPTPVASEHVGTGQAERAQAALRPESVALDERTLSDWLAFAHALARELHYYADDDRPAGDWSALFNPDGLADGALPAWWEEVAAFAEAPEAFTTSAADPRQRPHFVLFLAFLQLLRQVQGQFNTFTRRHLDFYYREVLGLAPQPALPDRVHVLVTPAAGVTQARLPAGTLLAAGKDSGGREQTYRTERDLLLGRAQVARLRSVYALLEQPDGQAAATVRNLYARDDATSALVPESGDPPCWRTFGQRVDQPDPAAAPAATLGWAIASPLLWLGEGRRGLTLTLGFSAAAFDAAGIGALSAARLAAAFQLRLSGAEGWLTPAEVRVEAGTYGELAGVPAAAAGTLKALRWSVVLDTGAAAVAPGAEAPAPTLRLDLQPRWESRGAGGLWVTDYALFQPLALERVRLAVEVRGLTALELRNDGATLDWRKPFDPFGTSPVPGSGFLVGHTELAVKRLDSVTFHPCWTGAPADLSAHYRNYPGADGRPLVGDNAVFTTAIALVDGGLTLRLAEAQPLFAAPDASAAHTLALADIPGTLARGNPGYSYTADPDAAGGQTWRRYLRWELNTPDLQHTAYPGVAAAKSIELSAAIANKSGTSAIDPAAYQVNPPYTPKLKGLTLDYSAAVEVTLKDYRPGGDAERLYHRHPFGGAEVRPDPTSGTCTLLPAYAHEGELYIGLRDLQPPTDLTLLLQLAEGSADPDIRPTAVEWSYLSDNRWISLHDGHLLADASDGLLRAGIVELRLPAAAPNTLLPPDLYWLRAALAQGVDGVCATVGIHPQAVSAVFVDQDNSADHWQQPLPAGTITRPVEPLAAVAALSQPYTGFDGRPAEGDVPMRRRVAERLRHKQRALAPWDYERLALERFPAIYKAKCLPAAAADRVEELGRVRLVVIPDIRNKRPFDPFAPKASAGLLARIRDDLAAFAPPFAAIEVNNAGYVRVKLRFAVHFHSGCDAGYYRRLLNDEVNRFLSPWAYDEGFDLAIGGEIYANSVIDYIEKRPYVDYVAQFKFFRSSDGVDFVEVAEASDPEQGYRVATDQPDQVLVAATQHVIDLIEEAGYDDDNYKGINYMAVQLDFKVG